MGLIQQMLSAPSFHYREWKMNATSTSQHWPLFIHLIKLLYKYLALYWLLPSPPELFFMLFSALPPS